MYAMNEGDWLERLQGLLNRFSGLGITGRHRRNGLN